MRIDIGRLAEDRELVLHETWDPAAEDLDAPGMHFTRPLDVAAFLKKDAGLVKARVALSGYVTLTCGRCLEDFDKPWRQEFTLAYPVNAPERSFEINGDIREEMIVNYPERILCREDCRGLCPKCGADLNKEKCKCQ